MSTPQALRIHAASGFSVREPAPAHAKKGIQAFPVALLSHPVGERMKRWLQRRSFKPRQPDDRVRAGWRWQGAQKSPECLSGYAPDLIPIDRPPDDFLGHTEKQLGFRVGEGIRRGWGGTRRGRGGTRRGRGGIR